MKYLLVLMIATVFASCSNTAVVETKEGQRYSVENPDNMYHIGDAVYLQHFSSTYSIGVEVKISDAYWCDTTVFTMYPDSTYSLVRVEKAVLVDY